MMQSCTLIDINSMENVENFEVQFYNLAFGVMENRHLDVRTFITVEVNIFKIMNVI